MSERSEEEIQRAVLIIAGLVVGPVVLIALAAWITQTLGPWLWVILVTGLAVAVVYVLHRFRTSAPSVRNDHEQELLDRIAVAERQQSALAKEISVGEIGRALANKGLALDAATLNDLAAVANRLYTYEFLEPLASMPGVPIEAERVYDIEYDRRTLRKGEEPPYRTRTDSHGRPTSDELLAFESWLHTYAASTVNADATRSLFVTAFVEILVRITAGTTITARGRSSFNIPLIDMLANGKAAIADAIDVAYERRVKQWHHFSSIRTVYERNRRRTSELALRVRDLNSGQLLDVRSFAGTPREALDAFLTGSPLYDLFSVPVPFAVPAEKRFEGQFVIARQGSGKTNALECLIFNDLAEVAAGRASLVVMDSQGLSRDALIGRLAKLEYFRPGGPLEDKLIYLEPDIDWPLALNIFDIGMRDLHTMPTREREAIIGSACDVIEFLFTGLLSGELSDNMTMLYRYLVPAMLAIPDADMNTFIELLDVGERNAPPPWVEKYGRYLGPVEREVKAFLETDFLRDPELIKTKSAVRRRLRAALADTNFRRMFTQPHNRLDLFTELQAGKVVLVNTFAAGNYVEQFGRLILSLLMQATHRRLMLDREDRRPTFVYLDECQDYVSREERIAKYIDKCRKQNVGLIFATQRLGTIENARVLNALKGVPIKLVGGSDADAEELASMVDSTAEHVKGLPRGRFSAYVSGITPHAVDIAFPLSPLEDLPRLNDQQFEIVRQEMRSRFSVRYAGETDEPRYADYAEVRPDVRRLTTSDGSHTAPSKDDDYDPLG